MKVTKLFLILVLLVLSVVFYHWLSFSVWQLRNPKANQTTFYTHYIDVITWRKLSKFQ